MKVFTNILMGFIAYLMVCYPKELLRYFVFVNFFDAGKIYKKDFRKNPLKCIDPVGFVTYILFDIGWSKSPVLDIYMLKKERKAFPFAILGPSASVVMFFVYSFLARVSSSPVFFNIFYTAALWSLTYATVSLFPLPPLDGSYFILECIDEKSFEWYIKYNFYGIIFMLGLVLLWVLPNIMYPLRKVIIEFTNFIIYKSW